MAKGWQSKDNQFAKAMTKWTGWKFRRTPKSGALRWGSDMRVLGDVAVEFAHAEEFPFSIELKTRKSTGLRAKDFMLMKGKPSSDSPLSWWRKQAVRDAERLGLIPWLSFRYNSMVPKDEYFVIWPVGMYSALMEFEKEIKAKWRHDIVVLDSVGICMFMFTDLRKLPADRLFSTCGEYEFNYR